MNDGQTSSVTVKHRFWVACQSFRRNSFLNNINISLVFFIMHQHYLPNHNVKSSCNTKATEQDVIRSLAHAQLSYFLAREATSHLGSCKLAEKQIRQRKAVKRLSGKEWKVAEGAHRGCSTKPYKLLDICGSMDLKGTSSSRLFKLFVSSLCGD